MWFKILVHVNQNHMFIKDKDKTLNFRVRLFIEMSASCLCLLYTYGYDLCTTIFIKQSLCIFLQFVSRFSFDYTFLFLWFESYEPREIIHCKWKVVLVTIVIFLRFLLDIGVICIIFWNLCFWPDSCVWRYLCDGMIW